MSRLLLLLPAAVSALTAGVMRAPAAAVARPAPLTMMAAAPAPAKVKVRHTPINRIHLLISSSRVHA